MRRSVKKGGVSEGSFLLFLLLLFRPAYIYTCTEPSIAEHYHLDSLYRQVAKLCEEERAILQDEPSDVIKNLGLLTALRQASEAEAPQHRVASLQKSRKRKNEVDESSPAPMAAATADNKTSSRIKGGVPRGASVLSQGRGDSRDNSVSVKAEEGVESSKSTISDRHGHLAVGAEVVFRHNKNKQGIEGEGIQCIIKGITGEGSKRRYAYKKATEWEQKG